MPKARPKTKASAAAKDTAERRPKTGVDVARALGAPRIVIERVSPSVDNGAFPAKAVTGQQVSFGADIFADGHDQLAACVVWQRRGERGWHDAPLLPSGNDRWQGQFVPEAPGLYRYAVEAWLDPWATYRDELRKKFEAGRDIALELEEGRQLVAAAARRSGDQALAAWAAQLTAAADEEARAHLLDPQADAIMLAARAIERRFLVRSAPLEVDVQRQEAGFAAWYELFPRSQTEPAADGVRSHGSFDDVIERLPAIRAMGFDVLYFPPIHPIGRRHRKGRNNSLEAAPGDPGSPYAIGSDEGGHDAVHPELGGIEAFRRLRRAAAAQGLELALDFAVQCSPDHPWLSEHPDWFSRRPDGSIRHAENPPKKYEDIVNVDFYAPAAMPSLWLALRDVVEYWIGEGVHTFRVDNPHTKPLPFWQWLIADIRSRHPDAIFLSEAFTRPKLMYRLAKLGFSQSYTYFTWRNGKQELTEYLTELTEGPPRDFFRPHFFVNTPDINPRFLQASGRAGFLIRAALAATLSGLWGMYAGFELCEARALPGKEEYLDSEKYQIRPRALSSYQPAADNIIAEVAALNRIRRANPALHTHLGLRFYQAWNEQVLFYGKATPARDNVILVLVSLDPHQPQEVRFEVPLWEFGLPDDGALEVEELVGGGRFAWHGKFQHWYFDPRAVPFAIFRVRPLEET